MATRKQLTADADAATRRHLSRATGPAAYHARIEREQIEALTARVAELEARLTGWASPYQAQQQVKEAVARSYAAGHEDGYKAGWTDSKHSNIIQHRYEKA